MQYFRFSALSALRGALRLGDDPRARRNVLALGFTSMFTDIAAEMVAAVLPLYLFYGLELSPFVLGSVDGIYQSVAALLAIALAVLADKKRRLKLFAGIGYAASAVTRLGLFVAAGWLPALLALVTIDRVGKGIRTGPRDALLSLSVPPHALGTAFGAHRALDMLGAGLGPLLAFALLSLAPHDYDMVWVVSAAFAILGLAAFVFFVDGNPSAGAPAPSSPAHDARPGLIASLTAPRFAWLVAVGAGLSILTVSEGLYYLVLQRRAQFGATYIPLAFVASAAVFAVLAIPAGRLADRFGRARVFAVGHAALGLSYAIVALAPPGLFAASVGLVLLGAYLACTDGVLAALASESVPPALRASGLSVVRGASALARFGSSVVFGALWSAFGAENALLVFAGLAVAGSVAAWMLWARRSDVASGPVG